MLRNNKISRISLRFAIISLLIIVLSRVCIDFILEKEFFTNFGEFLYSVCYILGYISIFTFLISVIILIINLVRKSKKVIITDYDTKIDKEKI